MILNCIIAVIVRYYSECVTRSTGHRRGHRSKKRVYLFACLLGWKGILLSVTFVTVRRKEYRCSKWEPSRWQTVYQSSRVFMVPFSHGRRSRGDRRDKSPQNLERGDCPQILSCCKILSTRLLALQC